MLLLAAAIAFTREPDFDDEEIDFDALDEWAAATPAGHCRRRRRATASRRPTGYDAFGKRWATDGGADRGGGAADARGGDGGGRRTWYADGVRVPMFTSDG